MVSSSMPTPYQLGKLLRALRDMTHNRVRKQASLLARFPFGEEAGEALRTNTFFTLTRAQPDHINIFLGLVIPFRTLDWNYR
jgi:hypothetical protein